MQQNNYRFQSQRLGFRNWREADLEVLTALNADEEVMRYFPKTLSPEDVVDLMHRLQKQFVENGFTYYATELLASGEFIGMIGLAHQSYESPFTPAIDIGWRLKKTAWGKGYATEGAQRCLKQGFDLLGLDKIIAVCPLQNQRSESVMQKIGMNRIGTFRHPELKGYPEYERLLCYEVKRDKLTAAPVSFGPVPSGLAKRALSGVAEITGN